MKVFHSQRGPTIPCLILHVHIVYIQSLPLVCPLALLYFQIILSHSPISTDTRETLVVYRLDAFNRWSYAKSSISLVCRPSEYGIASCCNGLWDILVAYVVILQWHWALMQRRHMMIGCLLEHVFCMHAKIIISCRCPDAITIFRFGFDCVS